jgi:tyrosyl-tRNA synthetase
MQVVKTVTAGSSIFQRTVKELSQDELTQLCQQVPSIKLAATDLLGKRLQDVVHTAKLASSKSEARRVIEQGGITINDQRIINPNHIIQAVDFRHNQFLVLCKGKKNIAILTSDTPVTPAPSLA